MIAGMHQSAPPRSEAMARRFDAIDERVRAIGTAMGACEMQYPVLIAKPVLAQAEYDQAFPHLLMSASVEALPASEANRSEPCSPEAGWCLSPAVCYHAYAQLAGQTIDGGVSITARGRCFRSEAHSEPGVRQIEFDMREIVFVGSAVWVDACLETARAHVEALALELGLIGDWQPATDPFFLPTAEGKAIMQRLLSVKLEYQLRPGIPRARQRQPPRIVLRPALRHLRADGRPRPHRLCRRRPRSLVPSRREPSLPLPRRSSCLAS